jgi:hypothetical protein
LTLKRDELTRCIDRLRAAFPKKKLSLGQAYAQEVWIAFAALPDHSLEAATTQAIQACRYPPPTIADLLRAVPRDINGSGTSYQPPSPPEEAVDTSGFADLWAQGQHPLQVARRGPEAFREWRQRFMSENGAQSARGER